MQSKEIVNVRAFLPADQEIIKIIEICKLHPGSTWKVWSDGFGNTIKISAKRKISIGNNLNLKYNDLYFKSTIKHIANVSNKVMLGLSDDVAFAWMLGQDSRLRYLVKQSGCWQNSSPLLSGLAALRVFVQNLNVEGPTQIDTIKMNGVSTEINGLIMPWPQNSLSEDDRFVSLTKDFKI